MVAVIMMQVGIAPDVAVNYSIGHARVPFAFDEVGGVGADGRVGGMDRRHR